MKYEEEEKEKKPRKKKRLALKDFEIHMNQYHYSIKKGDDISDIPVLFTENLKTEGVI